MIMIMIIIIIIIRMIIIIIMIPLVGSSVEYFETTSGSNRTSTSIDDRRPIKRVRSKNSVS